MKKYPYQINGKFKTSNEEKEVKNPANNESLGAYYVTPKEEVDHAVESALIAQKEWAKKSQKERDGYLGKIVEKLTENKGYLAEFITKEQGKPLAGPGSNFEMEACIGWTQATMSINLEDEVVFEDDTRKDVLTRTPIGVVAAITPWNWPLMIAIWQIIPAIKVGNTVVIKPSEYTSLASLEMFRLINEVLPDGVLNVITGGGEVGSRLTAHPDIAKIMFTGSIATGRKIIESSTDNMAKITLECGGNDAGIALPNTDYKRFAEDMFWGSFLNTGQTCAALKRLYVPEDEVDEAVSALSEVARKAQMGDGLKDGVVLGPIQNKMQYDKINDLIADSQKQAGAKFHTPNAYENDEGLFISLSFVTGLDNGNRLVDEEQFGPVLPIVGYKSIEDAIEKANALETGLGASVWGDNLEEAQKVADQMEAGTVWINQHGQIHPMVPFGGIKQSGYGVEFGFEGLKAVTAPKVVSLKK